MLRAAATAGWQASRLVRFRRSCGQPPFATAWRFEPFARDCDSHAEPETLVWNNPDGSPSSAWWDLVGSLYYWRLRSKMHLPWNSRWVRGLSMCSMLFLANRVRSMADEVLGGRGMV